MNRILKSIAGLISFSLFTLYLLLLPVAFAQSGTPLSNQILQLENDLNRLDTGATIGLANYRRSITAHNSPKMDADGKPVVGDDGRYVMESHTAQPPDARTINQLYSDRTTGAVALVKRATKLRAMALAGMNDGVGPTAAQAAKDSALWSQALIQAQAADPPAPTTTEKIGDFGKFRLLVAYLKLLEQEGTGQ